jgi:septal ring factor EnvC (AmiA/AmiB activator)
MKKISFVSVLILFFALFFIASTGYAKNIDQRVAEMHQRIDQGVQSGQITRPEEQRLRRELDKIRADEAKMKSDGRLTKREVDRLNRELDRLQKDIYLEKHDRQKRRR